MQYANLENVLLTVNEVAKTLKQIQIQYMS